MDFDVTLADVQAAATRIAGKVRRTPTYHSAGLSARLGVETWVKLESLQLAGSFKVRGCYNRLMGLSEAELKRMREAGRDFVRSPGFQPFSTAAFVDIFRRIVEEDAGVSV